MLVDFILSEKPRGPWRVKPGLSRLMSEQHAEPMIAMIGGGFSGTTLAAQLSRESDRSLSVTAVERGPGLADDTCSGWHLLNLPASKMSAFAE
jgi:hypothetical protein